MDLILGLRDILRNVSVADKICEIGVTGTQTTARCYATDAHKVIVLGEMNQPLDGVSERFIICNIDLLNKTIMHALNTGAKAVYAPRSNARRYSNILVKCADGLEFSHPFGAAFMQYNTPQEPSPRLQDITYDLVVTPTSKAIDLFAYWAKTLREELLGIERFTLALTPRGALYLYIEKVIGLPRYVRVRFSEGVTGSFSPDIEFPIDLVLDILALNRTSRSVKMSFSQHAILRIDVDSGLGRYAFFVFGWTHRNARDIT